MLICRMGTINTPSLKPIIKYGVSVARWRPVETTVVHEIPVGAHFSHTTHIVNKRPVVHDIIQKTQQPTNGHYAK